MLMQYIAVICYQNLKNHKPASFRINILIKINKIMLKNDNYILVLTKLWLIFKQKNIKIVFFFKF